jgi:hypothetical protein
VRHLDSVRCILVEHTQCARSSAQAAATITCYSLQDKILHCAAQCCLKHSTKYSCALSKCTSQGAAQLLRSSWCCTNSGVTNTKSLLHAGMHCMPSVVLVSANLSEHIREQIASNKPWQTVTLHDLKHFSL